MQFLKIGLLFQTSPGNSNCVNSLGLRRNLELLNLCFFKEFLKKVPNSGDLKKSRNEHQALFCLKIRFCEKRSNSFSKSIFLKDENNIFNDTEIEIFKENHSK